jgi:hypothetical protein
VYSVLRGLPVSRRGVLVAFANGGADVTVRSVAERLGLAVNTVKAYVRLTRQRHPEAYRLWRTWRAETLQQRYERSARRRRQHSDRWFRRLRKAGRPTPPATGQWARERNAR